MKILHQFHLDGDKPIVQLFLDGSLRLQTGDIIDLVRTIEPGVDMPGYPELSGYYRVDFVVHQIVESLSADLGHEQSILIAVHLSRHSEGSYLKTIATFQKSHAR